MALPGCITAAHQAVPASRLPCDFRAKPRSASIPIDFSLLRQQPPPSHIIGPHDLLGVYVQNILPNENNRQEPSVTNSSYLTDQQYYPPKGLLHTPTVGFPMEVGLNGNLNLPLIPPVSIAGLTLEEAAERVRRAYSAEGHILKLGQERVMISLIRPRVERIMVIRDDIPTDPVFQPQGNAALLARHGTGHVIDLPAYENDVMHALAASGGLPGVDAFSAIWVFRGRLNGNALDAERQSAPAGQPLSVALQAAPVEHTEVRIPLRVCPGEMLPFRQEDIVLRSGDVVYLETRECEHYYSGGLLPGGQIPLPRDCDLDVVGALALATGSVGGPAGGTAAAANNFRGGNNPGNIVPPTRVLVLRTLPSGEQVQIRVDLKKAMHDSRERLLIAPGDVVSLYYTPGECAANYAINLVTLNFSFFTNVR